MEELNPLQELQTVYVLTNPAMPGIVKIGMTRASDAGERIAALGNNKHSAKHSGLPLWGFPLQKREVQLISKFSVLLGSFIHLNSKYCNNTNNL
jgi:hypothetical protein